jgi:hypothetical protein
MSSEFIYYISFVLNTIFVIVGTPALLYSIYILLVEYYALRHLTNEILDEVLQKRLLQFKKELLEDIKNQGNEKGTTF